MSHSPTSPDDPTPRDAYEAGWDQILQLINTGGSWSGRERNCCLLNTGGAKFANVSAVTGLDFLDDGRSIATVDWDGDGDLDLWMSARTGPRLRLVRNDTRTLPGTASAPAGDAQANFVSFRLHGVQCNRDGIGARVHLTAGGVELVRTLRGENGYLTSSSKHLHFGLGTATNITKLQVRWPNGETEEYTGIEANRRYELTQGAGKATEWKPVKRELKLAATRLPRQVDKSARRVVLYDRLPVPTLEYQDFQGNPQRAIDAGVVRGPTLVTLWATWCAPCIEEFAELTDRQDELNRLGLRIVALSVDALDKANAQDSKHSAKTQSMWDAKQFPFVAGAANGTVLEQLDVLAQVLIPLRTQPNAIPASFLFDAEGRLAVLYPGPLEIDRLVADVRGLDAPPQETAFPFPGTWFVQPNQASLVMRDVAKEFYLRGRNEDACRYAALASDVATRDAVSPDFARELASILYEVGVDDLRAGHWEAAARKFTASVRLDADSAQAHANAGMAYRELGQADAALGFLQRAVALAPDLLQPHLNLGILELDAGRPREAARHFQRCLQIKDDFATGHIYLGIAFARGGQTQLAFQQFQQASFLGHPEAQQHIQTLAEGKLP